MAAPTPPPAPASHVCCDPDDPQYPGGAHCAAYQFAFNAWVVIFLTVVCAGFLNYLGVYLKAYWPGL